MRDQYWAGGFDMYVRLCNTNPDNCCRIEIGGTEPNEKHEKEAEKSCKNLSASDNNQIKVRFEI